MAEAPTLISQPADHTHSATTDGAPDPIELAIRRGNLQKAEFLCRQVLDETPKAPGALMQLGRIAAAIGAPNVAMTHYLAALETCPDTHWMRERLLPHMKAAHAEHAQNDPTPHPTDLAAPARQLLIKAWGYGFWSDLDHVLGQLLVAELTGRTPVVHWGSNSLFRGADTDNAFESFFEPVSTLKIDDLCRPQASYYPAKWSASNLRSEDVQRWEGAGSRLSGLYFLHRSEDIAVSDFHTKVNDLLPWIPAKHPLRGLSRNQVYRHLVNKYIKLQPWLQAEIDAQWKSHFEGRSWLAVHVRGSDKIHEISHLDVINQAYFGFIEKILQVNPSLSIFLLTDSKPVIAQFDGRYPGRILTLDCQRSDTHTGVHYSGHSGTELGKQVIIDSWLAARCHYFLGNGGSNVSVGVRHLKDWADGTFFLIGDDFLGQRNMKLHDW